MAIPVRCSCGAAFTVGDDLAGKRVRCAQCKKPVSIPAQRSVPAYDMGPQISMDDIKEEPAPQPQEEYWGKQNKKRSPKVAMPKLPVKKIAIAAGVLVAIGILATVVIVLIGNKKDKPVGTGGTKSSAGSGIELTFDLKNVPPEIENALRMQYVDKLRMAGIGAGTEAPVKLAITGKAQDRSRKFQPLNDDDEPAGVETVVQVPTIDLELKFTTATRTKATITAELLGGIPLEGINDPMINATAKKASIAGFVDRITQIPAPPLEKLQLSDSSYNVAYKLDLGSELAHSPGKPWRMQRWTYLLTSANFWDDLKLSPSQRIELAMMRSEMGGAAKALKIEPAEWTVPLLHDFHRQLAKAARDVLTPEQREQFIAQYKKLNLALPNIILNGTKPPLGSTESAIPLACVDYRLDTTPYGVLLPMPPLAYIKGETEEAQAASLAKGWEESFSIPDTEIKTPADIVDLVLNKRPYVRVFVTHWLLHHDAGASKHDVAAALKRDLGQWRDLFAKERDDATDQRIFAFTIVAGPDEAMDLIEISDNAGGPWDPIGKAARTRLFRDCYTQVEKYAREQLEVKLTPKIWQAAIWYRDEGRRRPENVDQTAWANAMRLDQYLTGVAAEVKRRLK